MSVKQSFNEILNLTEAQEKEFIRELNKAYNSSYKSIKQIVNNFIADYGVDGKLSQTNAMIYGRFQTLLKNIEKELKNIESLQTYQIKTFLKDAYELNYYGTGYSLESNVGVKLNFAVIDRNQVAKMINNPLMNIALDENKTATRQQIRRILTQAVVQGEGIQPTARKLRDRLNISGNRATKIARTETTKVMSQARNDGMAHAEKMGIELQKEWVATLDGRTRDSHASVDGETVDRDKPFSNGLMYPGDPSGGAEEVVNCRCTMVAKVKALDKIREEMKVYDDVLQYSDYEKWQVDRIFSK